MSPIFFIFGSGCTCTVFLCVFLLVHGERIGIYKSNAFTKKNERT